MGTLKLLHNRKAFKLIISQEVNLEIQKARENLSYVIHDKICYFYYGNLFKKSN